MMAADLEIISLNPINEFAAMTKGAVTPDFKALYLFRSALLNTLLFAFSGTALGVAGGTVLAFFFHRTPVRLVCSFVRSIHEIFWAFLFLPMIGLNAICGVLAIAIPYAGIFAKVYAEILQETNPRPLDGLPPNSSKLSRFFYGVMPQIYPEIRHYTSYRFECALRSSAVLGFIGLPTLGYHLETAFREGLYSQASVLLYAFFLLIASLRFWLKEKLVPVYVLISLAFISKELNFSMTNMIQFLTWDILPWPMRREGFLDGTNQLAFPVSQLWIWFKTIFQEEVLPGCWNTLVLTQIALALTGLLTLLSFPSRTRSLAGPVVRRFSDWILIVWRTTPEYILAYVFLQLWGPSMLPAVVAISFHNGAILAHITSGQANLIPMQIDAAKGRINRYFYYVLPRVYSSFLAFLFYRWEVMMRESAILGVLGIFTLGFYIDSAFSENKMDKALLLILFTALLNMIIDSISQRIRSKIKVSTKLVAVGGAA